LDFECSFLVVFDKANVLVKMTYFRNKK